MSARARATSQADSDKDCCTEHFSACTPRDCGSVQTQRATAGIPRSWGVKTGHEGLPCQHTQLKWGSQLGEMLTLLIGLTPAQ